MYILYEDYHRLEPYALHILAAESIRERSKKGMSVRRTLLPLASDVSHTVFYTKTGARLVPGAAVV